MMNRAPHGFHGPRGMGPRFHGGFPPMGFRPMGFGHFHRHYRPLGGFRFGLAEPLIALLILLFLFR